VEASSGSAPSQSLLSGSLDYAYPCYSVEFVAVDPP
jgi:hypothetical protein